MNPLDVFPGAEQLLDDPPAPVVMLSPPLVLTVDEAARRLSISRSLMRSLVVSDQVEAVRIGRLRRIPADALETFVASLRKPRSDEAA